MNPISAATHTDPYPYYAELRAEGGLTFHPELKLWVASSARAVCAVLAHADCRVRPAQEPVPKAIAGGIAGKVFGQLMRMNDGERQRCPRSAIEPELAALDLETINALVAARLITADADGVYKAMFRGPVCVVAALLGFTPAQARAVSELTADFVACLSPLSNDLQLAAADAAAKHLRGYFIELLAEPASDFLRAIQQRFTGDEDTLIANLIGLCSQTFEACAGLIGNTLLALRRQPALRGESIDALLSEVQRFDPPVQNTRRFVAAPCEIAGVRVEAGDVILVLLASANRDPALNEQPEQFLPQLADRRSFSFGSGRHQCPGQALAMSIAGATVREILGRGIDLNRLNWHYRPSLNGRVPIFSDVGA
ncbi:cytochrome P450 [Pseudomonas fluorescens]|uniref:Biotin biosynthesis cytochrome P450 n=1 Tax=Pseudomonas fluorescens TaxID=294 RepID=A0A5E7USW8_PSEFL|nr:cytochrome P450 [Pseudomonas fluorescens]VVQ13569.1 Biotin biosynthesis cytochrome P450 [Pseudomonas fluorescens]